MKSYRLVTAILAVTLLTGSALGAGLSPASRQPPAQAPLGTEDMSGVNDPYLVACLNELGRGAVSQGIEACTLALILDPKDPDALQLRGYGFLLQHRFDKAEEDFRAGLTIRPGDPEDLAGLGQSLVGQGQYSEAVVYFSKAVATSPSEASFQNGLCWARGATGKHLDLAQRACDAAIRLARGAAAPLNSKGLVELRQARYADAITDYTAALAAHAALPSAHFGRGLAQLNAGYQAAGVADILAARAGDNEIDSMFEDMGVLPKDCGIARNDKCPVGFPPRQPEDKQGNWLNARWLQHP